MKNQYSFYLSPKLFKALQQLAKKEKRKLSGMGAILLEEALISRQQKQDKESKMVVRY